MVIDCSTRIRRGLAGAAFSLLLLTTAASAQNAGAQSTAQEYRLHAGDQIDISVWGEEQLRRDTIIRPDGRVSFPLAGDVVAAGRTVSDVRKEIESRLKAYVSEPVVTITISNLNGNRVFVIGQVAHPGMFTMNPELTVVQSLTMAGGMTPFAKPDDIIILRGPAGGAQKVMKFSFGEVSRGRSLEQNIVLESGDVVIVP
jgi:polysaccharide export outer membrane protein